jgi:hypothetical protein
MLVELMTPVTIEVTLAAQEELQAHLHEADRF